jgi:hypothetical protein
MPNLKPQGCGFLHMKELIDAGKTQAEVAELLWVSANTFGRDLRKKRA